MKKFYADNYNKIITVFWTVFIFLLWLQYIHLSTLAEATLFLIVLIPAIFISHLLANKLLPLAIHRKKMKIFLFQFIGISLLVALMLASSYKLMMWAESEGFFPHSILLANRDSLMVEFLFAIPSTLVINFGFCGLRFYYENIKLQKAHLEIQLQVLQSQINPHFMFNVLNHIHVLMQTDVELASGLLLQYSEMLRFQLYKGRCDNVRLEEEVVFLKNFVKIEELRWGNKIKVDCHWPVGNNTVKIPPLLLFPFIENAFKYASRTIGKQGFVKIELEQENASIFLRIQNSKSEIDHKKDTETSGIGLDNTRKRLNLIFGENYRLTIREEEDIYNLKLRIWQI